MAKYFMIDTPWAWYEREMMTPPGFGSRRVRPDKGVPQGKESRSQPEKSAAPADSTRRAPDASSVK